MKNPIRIQQCIAVLAVVLFLGKILAWFLTGSVTVLTDALEGIVNMAAGFLGLFSITLSAKPSDLNHPFGHGKAEFLSSAVEGTLITISGFVILYEGTEHLIVPHKLAHLDTGLLIVACSGGINFLMGKFAAKRGEQQNSIVLMSAGNHLMTDAYSGIAIIIGLVILLLTNNKFLWLDSAVAMCFAVLIIRTGYKVLRRSVSGIMDEADMGLLQKMTDLLQANRQPPWVDVHHLRIVRYSSRMQVDAHLTLPRYFQVAEAGEEIKKIDALIRAHFPGQVEVFIQTEGCNPSQCHLCAMENCPVREHAFQQYEPWELGNIWKEARHS